MFSEFFKALSISQMTSLPACFRAQLPLNNQVITFLVFVWIPQRLTGKQNTSEVGDRRSSSSVERRTVKRLTVRGESSSGVDAPVFKSFLRPLRGFVVTAPTRPAAVVPAETEDLLSRAEGRLK